MLVREKNLRDEYREIVEKEQAKKEAEEKKLADLAIKAKKTKKVGGLKTKKNKK